MGQLQYLLTQPFSSTVFQHLDSSAKQALRRTCRGARQWVDERLDMLALDMKDLRHMARGAHAAVLAHVRPRRLRLKGYRDPQAIMRDEEDRPCSDIEDYDDSEEYRSAWGSLC